MELDEREILQLTDKFDLGAASGENDRGSVSQISPGYYNMNAVAFYLLKGRLLVVFYEVQGGTTTCVTFRNVEPDQIVVTLNEKLGFPFDATCLVMSARSEFSSPPIVRTTPEHGLGVRLYCEVNTMPKAS